MELAVLVESTQVDCIQANPCDESRVQMADFSILSIAKDSI
jgi:hypothetical protein